MNTKEMSKEQLAKHIEDLQARAFTGDYEAMVELAGLLGYTKQ
ncbi:hypothetical protein [Priestia megaterium]